MPSVVVEPKAIRAFASAAAFEAWLAKNQARAKEAWIKIFKKATGKQTVNPSGITARFFGAVAKKRAAEKALQGLAKSQTNSIAYRLHHVKTPELRAQHIARFVATLADGQSPVHLARTPKKSAAKPAKRPAKARKKLS